MRGKLSLSLSDCKTLFPPPLSLTHTHTLQVWNVLTGECALTLRGHTAALSAVDIHPESKTLVSGSKDQSVRVWDLSTGECR